ncbi:MAG: MFS transporter [Planctomycetia bacterium]|nr:MFS transporter [Planctomycetia bacterium]
MTDARPTRVRWLIVAVSTLMAVLLYLHRNYLGFAETFIKQDLQLSDDQIGNILAIFYVAYGLGQVPAGWLTDRFGARKMLTLYILIWSVFTALTGFATGFLSLLLFRFGFGLGQAGAYPAASSLLRKWVEFPKRGLASAVVSSGGRIGGVLAPVLTGYMIVLFVPPSHPSGVTPGDVLDPRRLCYEMVYGELPAPGKPPPPADAAAAPAAKVVVGRLILEGCSPEQRTIIERIAAEKREHIGAVNAALQAGRAASDAPRPPEVSDAERSHVAAALDQSKVVGRLPAAILDFLPLEREARRLLSKPSATGAEVERLQRLILEATYPHALRKVYVAGWRHVIWTYGAVGLVVGLVFWFSFRDTPDAHPWCNDAERTVVRVGVPKDASHAGLGRKEKVRGFPLVAILRSRSLWLSCLSQIGTNFGWVFLVNNLPRYFEKVHGVPVELRGWAASFVIAVGFIGMVLGGPLTDRLARRLGLRWGRALPMGLTRFVPAFAFLYCLANPGPIQAFVAFCAVAFFTDLGVPAVWAYMQDVGGKFTASILGWGNMWGNLGAALSSKILINLVGDDFDFSLVFIACAASFVFSGIAALGIDARKPIVREGPAASPA